MMSDHPTLDPKDWKKFKQTAHQILDEALSRMENASQGRVWTPMPETLKQDLRTALPVKGMGTQAVSQMLSQLLPYGVGNTHPRFFGWVHGAGSPGNIIPEMAAAAMNANCGGRNHAGIWVERQVIDWCSQIMGFPDTAGGLVVSGTSLATVIALKVARDQALKSVRQKGIHGPRLTGYCSAQAHACIARAFDILGLGSDNLRKIPCDAEFRMELCALEKALAQDRAEGFLPFVIIGTAGAVNVGAIDDLNRLADMAAANRLWFHIDGAFGATAMVSEKIRPKLSGLERADSLAFDFHKWLQVNYDAGCILIRSQKKLMASFSGRPEYLTGEQEGLAAGRPWPVDMGPELSRGFRALKVWAHLQEHGTQKLAAVIETNCEQAQWLGRRIKAARDLALLAPVALNIVCFRINCPGNPDALNRKLVLDLQQEGIAALSTTRIEGKLAIRVNLTNHRTRLSDLALLMDEIETRAAGYRSGQ